MTTRFISLILIYSLFTVTMILPESQAYFSDSASSGSNTFTTAENFGEETSETSGIVINEIFPSSDNEEEIIELFNSSASPINVSGWIIEDGASSDTLPLELADIQPGGYALILTNASSFSNTSSALVITLSNASIGSGLNANGDKLTIKDSSETIIDEMSYGDNNAVFSGIPTPNSEQTLQRIPNGIDTNTATDWSTGVASIGESN